MDVKVLRLTPQQDLKAELDAFAYQSSLEAGCIITCVGSLSKAVLRFAGESAESVCEGKFEIVSLTGTLSRHGSHYHICLADSTGQTLGGHLLKGCLVYTTAEIVVGILPDLSFRREHDSMTGYRELAVYSTDALNPTD
ncbi:MAG: DNA-binding protein [Leptolyngbyaceae cyanobacterium RM2_2_4]|nr:DNA-binding protein [Leptolyngbyaceae cyanobacterium SM1_4_3]NJN91986.1 DNA-binding protein [Leptolyngbyaceae cyanobacterium SL_5_14]NJO50688.1 DNA-binding protein [Leptolyngbyaceae cyanobacterium RM2_2_4]NJO66821.1 DNA-binding protein [Leptolyngbyaceae cyanobacterium RM1_405_57]